MASATKVAALFLAACLASAVDDQAAQSLRGSRPAPNATQNGTQPSSGRSIPNATQNLMQPSANRSVPNTTQNLTQPKERSSHAAAAGELAAANLSLVMTPVEGNASQVAPLLQSGSGRWSGWSQGGDKMWGRGAGVEAINGGNVGYYNRGMSAARSRCGGAGCALITNPPGHRTINQFHIHFVHYAGWGANLKRRLERKVCGKSGWRRGGLPCHGRAAFFEGFPGVFTAAMGGTGSLHHASVIAWPQSCGGRGTIVELAFGCSIEHQIRGDYDPSRR